ncbi:YceH family protein [Labrys okinawensis]|uniref:YceH family protein n=1 Tax=Labrys okinawensis TaxID=346911 RepID=UPI0039BCAAE5
MSNDLFPLNALETRVFGCLLEKQLLTPDAYPLTSNLLLSATNQKTSREPVMALDAAEIGHTLASLERKGLVRRAFGSRVERYEHLAGQTCNLTKQQSALLAVMLLRGPQTLNELQTRTERMASFGSAEEMTRELDLLASAHPPLVKEIGRAPGQREDRYAHLLCGDVEVSAMASAAPRTATPSVSVLAALEERVRVLEEQVTELKARLEAVGG